MRFHRIVRFSAIALLLLTCTSCSVEELDSDRDGFISKLEFLSAAFDAVCGDQDEPDVPADEPPTDEPPLDEPPTDEPPVGETPLDEPPVDETTD
jgi:hypothetical protein